MQDAVARVPEIHRFAIPDTVMNSLVTCIATVKRTKCRCLCPKVSGTDYCSAHQSAIKMVSEENNTENNRADRESLERENKSSTNALKSPFISINALINNIRTTIKDTHSKQKNFRKWRINCIEDAFLCERNDPFPLGLVVRRFFPGHGMFLCFAYCILKAAFSALITYHYKLHRLPRRFHHKCD